MKKVIALILSLIMLFSAGMSLAEGPVTWLYSFSAGEVLQGEGMDKIREFLDAVQVQLTTEKRDSESRGEAVLISYGKPVLTLRAVVDDEEGFGLYFSLMGDCTLKCRKDQVEDFMLTLVQMLADLKVLKQDSLTQAQGLARKASSLIMTVVEAQENVDPSLLLDLNFYLRQAESMSGAVQTEELDAANAVCPGAVSRRVWQLNEDQLNSLVNTGIEKIKRIPMLSNAFLEGRIVIGSQAVTEDFLRSLVSASHGTTTLEVYTDAAGEVLRMTLYTPDISEAVSDPELRQVQGIEFAIQRENTADGKEISETVMRLLGLEGTLISVRTEKGPGAAIADLPTATTYQVGEMDSAELWSLIRGLGLTIVANTVNIIMDLPRIVFDTLVDKIF